VVNSQAHWDAITSATRFEILEQMRSAAPCSVAELARQMDRPADGLYHHLRKLLEAGLIREVGSRAVGKQVEAVYDLAYDTMIFEVDPRTGRNVLQMQRLTGTLMRLCGRVVEAAISNPAMVGNGAPQNTWSRLDTTWLTPEALAEVNGHLSAIRRLITDGNQRREGQLITVGVFGGPALRPRRADGNKPEAAEAEPGERPGPERMYRIARLPSGRKQPHA
jgi:predicted transcriptional regulator